ncbi:MAG: T9SS type A sorting domain-containing protein, partial [Sphingobacteriales bacterium]
LLVTDLSGRVVFRKEGVVQTTAITVPTASLPNGLYLLQMQLEGSTRTMKLQVQH